MSSGASSRTFQAPSIHTSQASPPWVWKTLSLPASIRTVFT